MIGGARIELTIQLVAGDDRRLVLLVLGEKAGIELARARDMTALFVLQDGDGVQEISITAGRSG